MVFSASLECERFTLLSDRQVILTPVFYIACTETRPSSKSLSPGWHKIALPSKISSIGKNIPDFVQVNIPVICFFLPFLINGTLFALFWFKVWFGAQDKGVWSKFMMISSGMSCHICSPLSLRWKFNLASYSRPGSNGIFSVVAFRRYIFALLFPYDRVHYDPIVNLKPHFR